jgi:chromate transporter
MSRPGPHSALEVFRIFLRLGLSSFGGPIAHLGYFREEFVMRRHWLDDAQFTDLVALCQVLPGPASSQVGLSIGLARAGYGGALAAWAGFTLPSAGLLLLFAYGADTLGGPIGRGFVHGLDLVAVAVIAQAVVGMARTLCPDLTRAMIGALAAALTLLLGGATGQILVIALGALAGFAFCRAATPDLAPGFAVPASRRAGVVYLAFFCLLLLGAPLTEALTHAPGIALFDACYRSGALVFGGGHVVLPLLREAFVTPGWVSESTFLAGYGAAQAVPGPLFSFAAFLGSVQTPHPHGPAGAALGLLAIFLPGVLILLGTLPFWGALRQRIDAQAAFRGVNAAVVGLLAAALYSPLWTSTVRSGVDMALAIGGFVLLRFARVPPLVVVLLGALAGIGLGVATAPATGPRP